ncbi:MAG TPA: hypothetical protein VGG91_22055 [Myxococcaceae bacterium]
MKMLVSTLLVLLCSLVAAAPDERAHCNLAALTSADRARDRELVPVLAAALLERKELPDGYAYRFDRRVLKLLGEWVEIEAKCCQPLSYELSLEPQPGGALWVRITGREAKEFIGLEFAPLTARLAAKEAGR